MTKQFASAGDLTEKTVSFTEIGRDLWAFTAEGDPNSGVIIGENHSCISGSEARPASSAYPNRMAISTSSRVRSISRRLATKRSSMPGWAWAKLI